MHECPHVCLGAAVFLPLLCEISSISTIYFHGHQELLHIEARRQHNNVKICFCPIGADDTSLVKRLDTQRNQVKIWAVQAFEVVGVENSALTACVRKISCLESTRMIFSSIT